LIERLLKGHPTLFQDHDGHLFIADDISVRPWESTDTFSRPAYGNDLWALIDSDTKDGVPHSLIRTGMPINLRVVMTWSVKKTGDTNWLDEKNGRHIFMHTWSMKEILVTGCVVHFFIFFVITLY
jgi:hypothetical protein